MRGRAARPECTPDLPLPFYAERWWLAIKTTDSAAVHAALRLRTVLPANWAAGVDRERREGVFVSPPVDGFVLVIGGSVLERPPGDLAELLCELSRRFGEVQWFYQWESQLHAGWALAIDGRLVRGYAFDGSNGEPTWDEGAITRAEQELGFFVDDPRDQSDDPVKWWPAPRDVARLAARWGIDPRQPGRGSVPAVGVIGRL